MQKVPFDKKDTSKKFHFKVSNPHFKLWKALFKRDLERIGKNKNVFDVEKDGGIVF